MTTLTMRGRSVTIALSHLALYGAAAMAEGRGVAVRLGWSRGLEPCPELEVEGDAESIVAKAVRDTAASADWVRRDVVVGGATRGAMSPRLGHQLEDTEVTALHAVRHEVIDAAEPPASRLFGALGEPGYWYKDHRGEANLYNAANRWEMQPRNRGSEIVTQKYRKLALSLADRSVDDIADRLCGRVERDDVGGGRAATGLAPTGPADSVIVWCALWGLSWLPVIHQVPPRMRSRTAGVVHENASALVLPVLRAGLTPARVRTVLASSALVNPAVAAGTSDAPAATGWLANHGVLGVARFETKNFGSGNAAEYRVHAGRIVRLG